MLEAIESEILIQLPVFLHAENMCVIVDPTRPGNSIGNRASFVFVKVSTIFGQEDQRLVENCFVDVALESVSSVIRHIAFDVIPLISVQRHAE